ncbi:MAG: TonB family protein [Akkermansiaceae bacterium]
MNQGVIYALNVITLATWLSVGLGALVGFGVSQDWVMNFAAKPPRLEVLSVVDIAPADSAAENVDETSSEETPAESENIPVTTAAPSPPPMPEITPMTELPEIPELPAPIIKKTATQVAAPTPAKPSTPSSTNSRPSSSNKPAKSDGSAAPSAATTLSMGAGAGRYISLTYPRSASSKNQQGTVVIEFIVGVDGKVLSAWVKTPCPYDILNNAALSGVRRAKFPPGEARRYKVPIIWQLK